MNSQYPHWDSPERPEIEDKLTVNKPIANNLHIPKIELTFLCDDEENNKIGQWYRKPSNPIPEDRILRLCCKCSDVSALTLGFCISCIDKRTSKAFIIDGETKKAYPPDNLHAKSCFHLKDACANENGECGKLYVRWADDKSSPESGKKRYYRVSKEDLEKAKEQKTDTVQKAE